MKKRNYFALALALSAMLSGCGHKPNADRLPPPETTTSTTATLNSTVAEATQPGQTDTLPSEPTKAVPETTPDITETPQTQPTEPETLETEAPTEPEPPRTEPTAPKPTEPKPTSPKPTEPRPTEPKPTEPKPTQAPTAPPTEAPSVPPTEAPTAPPTEAPTEPPATEPAPTEKADPPTVSVVSYNDLAQIESGFLALVNQERASQGLPALTYNSHLEDAALQRSQEIISYFSHSRIDGTQWYDVVSRDAYPYTNLGENICYTSHMGTKPFYREDLFVGKPDQIQAAYTEIFNGFRNSPGHYANMINPKYLECGIGVSYHIDEKTGMAMFYVAHLFGSTQ